MSKVIRTYLDMHLLGHVHVSVGIYCVGTFLIVLLVVVLGHVPFDEVLGAGSEVAVIHEAGQNGKLAVTNYQGYSCGRSGAVLDWRESWQGADIHASVALEAADRCCPPPVEVEGRLWQASHHERH